jgi:hypothetical protein
MPVGNWSPHCELQVLARSITHQSRIDEEASAARRRLVAESRPKHAHVFARADEGESPTLTQLGRVPVHKAAAKQVGPLLIGRTGGLFLQHHAPSEPFAVVSRAYSFLPTAAADFSVSNNGMLAYKRYVSRSQLAWVHRGCPSAASARVTWTSPYRRIITRRRATATGDCYPTSAGQSLRAGRCCRKRLHDCDILDKLLRQTMPGLKVCGTVVRDPDLAIGILPNKDLQWQIDRDTR